MARTVKKSRKITTSLNPNKPAYPTAQEGERPMVKCIEVQVSFLLSDDEERDIEAFQKEVQEALFQIGAKRVTPSSGYYLVDGKVCLAKDFDPVTRDFKPGTYPPAWAGGPDEKEILKRIDREANLPMMARNPSNLRTAKETDRLHELQRKQRSIEEAEPQESGERSTKDALRDFYENTEAGRRRAAEKSGPEVLELDDDDDVEALELDDEEPEELFELDDLEDEEGLDEALTKTQDDALAVLQGKKPKTSSAPKRRVVRRR